MNVFILHRYYPGFCTVLQVCVCDVFLQHCYASNSSLLNGTLLSCVVINIKSTDIFTEEYKYNIQNKV